VKRFVEGEYFFCKILFETIGFEPSDKFWLEDEKFVLEYWIIPCSDGNIFNELALDLNSAELKCVFVNFEGKK
jgi:hypothetical protein